MEKPSFLIFNIAIFLFSLALVAIFSVPLAYSKVERLRVVLDWDYPPFTYLDAKGAFVGISVDFWRRFEEKTGV